MSEPEQFAVNLAALSEMIAAALVLIARTPEQHELLLVLFRGADDHIRSKYGDHAGEFIGVIADHIATMTTGLPPEARLS